MDLRKFKRILSTGTALLLTAAAVPFSASAADDQIKGTINGYTYEMWNGNFSGDISMTPTEDGFECSWDGIQDCLFNRGYEYNKNPKTYKQLKSDIIVDYDFEYSPNGNSFFGVYGWTLNPMAEFYIVEGWTSWRPPGSDLTPLGTVTSDGNVYDIYKYMRYNQPSIWGTSSFPSYYNVRKKSSSKDGVTQDLHGSVNVTRHFNAWSNLGFDVSGTIYNVTFNIDCYRSSGSANVRKVQITPKPTMPAPLKPDSNGYYIKSKFDNGQLTKWNKKGISYFQILNDVMSRGRSLFVSHRSCSSDGLVYALDPNTFKPNTKYSIGASMMQSSLDNSTFRITMEYTDKNGILQNDLITAVNGKQLEWTDISNLSYTIPDGAIDLKLVFTTDDNEEFYLDDFYVGDDGTAPLAADLEGTKNEVIIQGDINNDGVVDIYDMPAMRRVLISILSYGVKPTINADLNGDGDVNIADLVMLHKYLRGVVKEFKQPVTTTTTTTTTTAATETTIISETTTVDTTSAAAASEATAETTATINTTEVTTEETSKTTTIVTTTAETETTASEPTTVGTTTEKPSTTTKVYVNYNAQIRQDMPTNVPSNAQKSSKCKVEKKTYTCKFTGGTKSCNVILPPDYDSNKEYPVMYVLHGIGGDENSMLNGMGVQELLTGLTANGEAEDMIIVLPSQYTSKDGNGSFGINQETCAAYDNFLYDISDSLIPFIEENYPVKTGRENRAITGFSMGGREAIYIGLMRPDLFGYVGGACPAPGITPGKDMFMEHPGCMTESEMKFRDVGPEPAVFMITGGTNDSVVGTFPQEYSDILTKNGVDHVYQSIPGGGHDGGSVKPHLYTFMRYAFK